MIGVMKKNGRISTKNSAPKPSQGAANWLFCDRHGKVVIFQMPNLPIIVAGLAWLALLFVRAGAWHATLEVILNAGLITWAGLEVGWGTTRFRRALGFVVLIWILVHLLLGVYGGTKY